jgi:drug/metabolite transporter (DMT)-like permease
MTRRSAEERLRRLYVGFTAVSVCAMVGLGFTALRGPGTGFVLVFAAALLTAAGLVATVVHRRLKNRRWPPYRPPS